jgi:hypothetical protein
MVPFSPCKFDSRSRRRLGKKLRFFIPFLFSRWMIESAVEANSSHKPVLVGRAITII